MRIYVGHELVGFVANELILLNVDFETQEMQFLWSIRNAVKISVYSPYDATDPME